MYDEKHYEKVRELQKPCLDAKHKKHPCDSKVIWQLKHIKSGAVDCFYCPKCGTEWSYLGDIFSI
jgi:hypothetical protein